MTSKFRAEFARTTTIAPTSEDPSFLLTFGFRRCYRRPDTFHGVANLKCNCLRTEIPVEARAKSSGALATDHERMYRDGRVAHAREAMESAFPGSVAHWDRAERSRKRGLTDRSLRAQVSSKRAAGELGRKA